MANMIYTARPYMPAQILGDLVGRFVMVSYDLVVELRDAYVAERKAQKLARGFLGLGIQPPAADWGLMLSQGRKFIRLAPHLTIFPGVAIIIIVLAFNLLGDGLRDVMDVKDRG